MRLRIVTLLAAAARAGCGRDDARPPARPAGDVGAAEPTPWRANPAEGVQVTGGADSVVVETGPHAILFHAGQRELQPPYTVRAEFEKRSGRLHEGYGLIFGGTALDGPEAGQAYSYFLVRGDGSFLVKRRQGAATPVVRDWTQNAAIRRDQDETGRPNELEVAVTDSEAVFRVNGTEVARVPASELSVRGEAGVRTSHQVALVVRGFRATAGLR